MLCSQCGNENPTSNRFCGNCGAKLEAAPPPSEASSRPVAPPLDLRDPTDPGHIMVPANGRNATQMHGEEVATVTTEPPAHEVGPELDAPVAYAGEQTVAAEAAEPSRYVAAAASSDAPAVEAPPRRRDTSIHGPSLLGLSDDDAPEASSETPIADYSYLYEDEGGGRGVNWRLMLALVVLIGFAGVLAYMWSQGKNWNTTIVKGITGEDQKAPPPVVAKTEPPTTPGAPEIAVNPTPKNLPANTTPQSDEATGAKDNLGPAGTAATNQPAKNPSDNKTAATPASKPADTAGKTGGGGESTGAKNNNAAKDNAEAKSSAADANADNNDAGDEEDAQPAAPAKAATTTAKAKKKASAAKQSRADDSEADDVAMVHRADALLKSHACNQAVDLFREAALHGNATARSRLGGLYATGHCVPLDRAEAYNWFTLAKDAGAHYSWIDHNRNMLWAQMTDRERERVMRR